MGASFALAGGSLASAGQPSLVIVHDSRGDTHVMSLDSDGQMRVETDKGYNVISVEDGVVRIVDADCPNQDCMHQAALTRPGQQLICLPHELWVEVSAEYAGDGLMDVGAVDAADAGQDAGQGGVQLDTVAR